MAGGTLTDFIRGFGERKRAGQVKEELKNYLNAPELAIANINEIEPSTAIALRDKYTAEQAAAVSARQGAVKNNAEAFTRITGYLRGLPKGSDYGAALDNIAPFAKGALGATDNELAQWKTVISANPAVIDILDDEARKAFYDSKVISPGAALTIGGKVVHSQPFAPKVESVPNATGGKDVIVVDPNKGGSVGAFSPLTVEALRPHFVAQESSGDYAAVNGETGALGRYQVMPATGEALAKRLGLGWRPDMMRKDDPQSRKYQDAIGDAAIQEAIDKSGGDPAAAFSYYYSGSPTAYKDPKGNPKTAKYVADMSARVGSGAASAAQPVYSSTGKPTGVRAATPEEVAAAGYPTGTAAQVDATGKFVNLKTPPAGVQTARWKALPNAGKISAVTDQIDDLWQAADRLSKTPDIGSYTGSLQGRLPSWLSRGRDDFNARLEALKTKIGFSTLQAMREMSKTGGALGNVSNFENKLLQQAIDSLNAAQSEEQFVGALETVKKVATRSKKRVLEAAEQDAKKAGAGQSKPNVPAVGAIAVKRNAQGEVVARMRFNGKGWEPVR